MKYANKIGAEFVIVVGDNELESGIGKLKNMESGEEIEVKLSTLADDFADIAIKQSVAKLTGELDTDEFAGVDMSGIDINALFGGKF